MVVVVEGRWQLWGDSKGTDGGCVRGATHQEVFSVSCFPPAEPTTQYYVAYRSHAPRHLMCSLVAWRSIWPHLTP